MKTSQTLISYVEQCALITLEKQDKLELLIGDSLHELDLDAGKLRFNDFDFPLQVLGTESDNTLTWLWAWADEQTEIAAHLMRSAQQLKTWGADHGVPEFTVPSVDVNSADGMEIGLVAADVCSASCFFADHYEGGAAYFLLFDRRIDDGPSFDRQHLITRMADLFSQYDLNQRSVLESYLRNKGLRSETDRNMISTELENGERLVAEFDDTNRLVMVNNAAFEI